MLQVQLMIVLLKFGICKKVIVSTQSFPTATAMHFASAQMNKPFVQVTLMEIFDCGIYRLEKYLVKLLLIHLLLHLFLCLEMGV